MYLPASMRNGALIVGMPSALGQRVWQNYSHLAGGFPKRYRGHALVWNEIDATSVSAIPREKANDYPAHGPGLPRMIQNRQTEWVADLAKLRSAGGIICWEEVGGRFDEATSSVAPGIGGGRFPANPAVVGAGARSNIATTAVPRQCPTLKRRSLEQHERCFHLSDYLVLVNGEQP